MASLPQGTVVMAVTPSNYEEIINASTGHPFEEAYTVERLKEIRAEAIENNNVAFVCFFEDNMWHREEKPGTAVHGELDGFRA